ncbi:MAG: hypothetical protein H7Y00_09415 [Fimbriimonadaceae bacterium]|nr:hypothetical protein [Chitinophagales bacterium]
MKQFSYIVLLLIAGTSTNVFSQQENNITFTGNYFISKTFPENIEADTKQKIDLGFRDNNSRQEIKTVVALISGMCDGFSQTLYAHYPEFQKKFPGANEEFWNPAISWKNKYENGDPALGERFPGSTTVFVFSTDAYHLFRTINKANLITIGGLEFSERKKFKEYALDLVIYSIVYATGFHLTYSIIFK